MMDDDEDEGLTRFRQYRAARDPALRNELWMLPEHQEIVRDVVGRYFIPQGEHAMTMEDVEQTAQEALQYAIERYDPDGLHHGKPFYTVAAFAMRSRIRHELGLDQLAIPDQPTVILRPFIPITPPSWLLSAERITRELPLLAAPGPSVEEQVAQTVDGAQVSATLEAALLLLSERQRYIIGHRYGLDAECVGGVAWTQRETAQALGISQQAVSKQERNALARLRRELTTHADGVLALRALHERQRRQRRASKAA